MNDEPTVDDAMIEVEMCSRRVSSGAFRSSSVAARLGLEYQLLLVREVARLRQENKELRLLIEGGDE